MKRRTLAPDRAALAEEIAGLSKAGIANLRERWKTLYGKQPPGGLGRSFLIRAIAYRFQEQACGGLKPSTRRLLARVAEEAAAGSSPKRPPVRKAEMGTILVREWQGNAQRQSQPRTRLELLRQYSRARPRTSARPIRFSVRLSSPIRKSRRSSVA